MKFVTGLNFAMGNENTHEIIVITNSITIASKVLEFHVNPFQKIVILLVTKIKSFLSKDNKNTIHLWQCPKKAK